MTPENKEKHIYGSDCCKAELESCQAVTKKTGYGLTYYHNRCLKCGNLCKSFVLQIYDSAGVEIKAGDIIESPEEMENSACRYHAAYLSSGELEIRDLGHNNIYMYKQCGEYFNRGHYSKHLDKLDDEDLEYYWDTTREEAQKLLEGDD